MNYFKNSFLYLILFISGFCSLVYQVSWERLIRSHFGGDSISAYIVTSTFLLGLGLGAFIFRNTKKNSFNLYAKVEISIALLALLSYFLISNFSNFILDLFSNHI
jgi:predicted membrane-bound spermidine synthase